MITLAINHSVNKQQLDEAIFRFMGDPTNNKFPKTCHLLEVMEYLQQKEDFTTQTLLLDLISNYVSYNGSHHYI